MQNLPTRQKYNGNIRSHLGYMQIQRTQMRNCKCLKMLEMYTKIYCLLKILDLALSGTRGFEMLFVNKWSCGPSQTKWPSVEEGKGGCGGPFHITYYCYRGLHIVQLCFSFPSRLSQPNICPHNGTKTPHNPQQARKNGLVPFPHTSNVCVYEKRIARLKTQVLCKIDLKICFCFLFSNHITKYTFVTALP